MVQQAQGSPLTPVRPKPIVESISERIGQLTTKCELKSPPLIPKLKTYGDNARKSMRVKLVEPNVTELSDKVPVSVSQLPFAPVPTLGVTALP